jgi:hypothetical protein
MMSDKTEMSDSDIEIVILVVTIVIAVILGYRNRDRIKELGNELLGKLTANK